MGPVKRASVVFGCVNVRVYDYYEMQETVRIVMMGVGNTCSMSGVKMTSVVCGCTCVWLSRDKGNGTLVLCV